MTFFPVLLSSLFLVMYRTLLVHVCAYLPYQCCSFFRVFCVTSFAIDFDVELVWCIWRTQWMQRAKWAKINRWKCRWNEHTEKNIYQMSCSLLSLSTSKKFHSFLLVLFTLLGEKKNEHFVCTQNGA